MLIKASRFYGIGLTLGAIAAIAACSSDPETPGGGTAGSTSQAGTGTNTAGTGTNTAGTGTNTAGTGTNTAGTGTNTAGTGAGGGSSTACAGVKPAAPLITQFDDLVANPMNAGQFTFTMGVPGGTFSYEKPAITVTDMGKALNAKGMVAAYDGFGLYLNMCTDASAYTGVSFSIKGSLGTSTKTTLNFRVQSSKNTKIDTVNKKGECVGTTYEECHDAGFDIPVTADAKVIEVKFSQLAGGLPSDTVSGKDVLGFEWAFPYTVGDAAYAADVTIDDLKFTGGSTGGSGSGGSGGASGGSGGASGGSGGASGGSGGTGGAAGGSGGTGGA